MTNLNEVEPLSKGKNVIERFLAFSLNSEDYAVPLLSVKEVIALPEITPLPNSPPYFLGIMNLRGQVISVIDLRLKFCMKGSKTPETAVIICDLGNMSLGVVVDCVNSVLSLNESEISPKPDAQGNKKTDYISGVTQKENKLILLLDIAKALDMADHAALNQAGIKKGAA